MSQSDAVSPTQQKRRGHRRAVRLAARATGQAADIAGDGKKRAYMRSLGVHRNHGRGRRRRAFALPVHPTVISAAIRAAHTERGATDDQMRAVRRHVDRLERAS